jgi:16S rRNA (guanine527-N7)-methyltransferase
MTFDPLLLPAHLDCWQTTLAWQPTLSQQQQFQRLYEGVLAGNQQLNLTRITEPDAFWEKHLWDSLCGIQDWLTMPPRSIRVIDIGTGAGFPGLPVAIALPKAHVLLLDSTQKKIAFLQRLMPQLDLDRGHDRLQAQVGRAEVMAQNPHYRGRYDLALVRAVGSAIACAEYSLPFLKVGGFAVLYRGHWTEEEAALLTQGSKRLQGQVVTIRPLTTPLTQGVRHYLTLKKVANY